MSFVIDFLEQMQLFHILSSVFEFLISLVVWLLLPPLLPGIVNKVKAWVAGRKGPRLFQLYYDLAKLWKRGVVLSDLASPGFIAATAVSWIAILAAALLVPLGPISSLMSFSGDALLLLYLLALSRFCTSWAALETGSAFEGMGVAREVSFAILTETALITAVLTLAIKSSSLTLSFMLAPTPGAGTLLLLFGLFAALLAESCRVPVDDPNTHLELTMIHEAMILDHSGPLLAASLHGAAMKLLLFSVLLVKIVLPLGELSGIEATVYLIAGIVLVSISVGLVESFLARYAFRKVPLFLTTAFLFCFFALLTAWKGFAQ